MHMDAKNQKYENYGMLIHATYNICLCSGKAVLVSAHLENLDLCMLMIVKYIPWRRDLNNYSIKSSLM